MTGPGVVSRGLVGAIAAYQRYISPFLGPRCRFYPSCSAYAVTALRTHGVARALWLSAHRICRCHPWNRGGYDPVPPRISKLRGSPTAASPAPAVSARSAVSVTASIALPSTSVPTAGVTRC